jgi:hypothetical protein
MLHVWERGDLREAVGGQFPRTYHGNEEQEGGSLAHGTGNVKEEENGSNL